MTDRPLISMCLIARDEAVNIERCFSQWWDQVDEVVLVDTGSKDDTIATAKAFAKDRRQSRKLKIGRFKWCQDFGAARAYADSLATGEWLAWCDLDDDLIGMDRLRGLIETAGPETEGFFCHYEYARDEHGTVVSELWRERVVRAGIGEWRYPVHECKVPANERMRMLQVPPSIARWVHRREHNDVHPDRNLDILIAWDQREPDQPRVVAYIATELLGMQRKEEALEAFERYLALPMEAADNWAQNARLCCALLCQAGRLQDAKMYAFRALDINPAWPDTYMTLAEIAHGEQRYAEGLTWVDHAEHLGKPATHLIINPTQYSAQIPALRAACFFGLGRLEEAIDAARQALAIAPGYMGLDRSIVGWQAELHRQRTAGALVNLAQVAIGNDEPARALQLLDAAPVFVSDDPSVVGMRTMVARRMLSACDKHPEPVADTPAGHFLISQLRAQASELKEAA